jgi:hypothetical protein
VPQALVAMVPRDPRRNVLIMMGSASMLLSRYLLTSQRCGRSVASSVASRRRCHDLQLRLFNSNARSDRRASASMLTLRAQ